MDFQSALGDYIAGFYDRTKVHKDKKKLKNFKKGYCHLLFLAIFALACLIAKRLFLICTFTSYNFHYKINVFTSQSLTYVLICSEAQFEFIMLHVYYSDIFIIQGSVTEYFDFMVAK